MATKPSATFVLATDANFGSGPASGNPTKLPHPTSAQGYIPGNGIEPESVNYLLNICGDWVSNWLALGSSANDETAHLVETTAAGVINVFRGIFGAGAGGGTALSATSNASGAAASFTDTVGNFAVVATAGGSLAGVRGTNTGTGAGVEGLALGTDNNGVKGTGTGAGHGVLGTGGATGHGVDGVGGATSGAGVRGTGGAAGGTGVLGIGFAASSSLAVDGQAGHDDATAVRGLTTGTASASAAGVLGFGQGAGVGVKAQAADGYALLVVGDLTAPVSASMRVAAQNAEPSGTDAEGDLYTTASTTRSTTATTLRSGLCIKARTVSSGTPNKV